MYPATRAISGSITVRTVEAFYMHSIWEIRLASTRLVCVYVGLVVLMHTLDVVETLEESSWIVDRGRGFWVLYTCTLEHYRSSDRSRYDSTPPSGWHAGGNVPSTAYRALRQYFRPWHILQSHAMRMQNVLQG